MIMKNNYLNAFILLLIVSIFSNVLYGQSSSNEEVVPAPSQDSLQNNEPKQKKDKKRKDEFKIFAGANFNNLDFSSETYKPTTAAGWSLGASYKRGKFFYWELGAMYNNPVYNLSNDSSSYLDGVFGVQRIDIPVSFGVNILSVTSRIVGFRAFVSGIPSFAIGVGGNDLNISMDNINAFNFYGQAGVGVDVIFLFVEAGFNYGFSDLFQDYSSSNPYQAYVNLGFRF
jgi:hypothetical protein